MKLNHFANRVSDTHFETVVELLTSQLGFVVLRRGETSIHMRQPGANIDLQFSRSATVHRDGDKKRSQVSFLSATPEAALEEIATWARAHGLEASVGAYSTREFFLDVPDAFVDFVIEAMTPDCAAYDINP